MFPIVAGKAYDVHMPNRRVFMLIVITGTLLFPARQTVRGWARRQLIARQPGSVLHGAGEVVVTIL
jgi:hypothetical protein